MRKKLIKVLLFILLIISAFEYLIEESREISKNFKDLSPIIEDSNIHIYFKDGKWVYVYKTGNM